VTEREFAVRVAAFQYLEQLRTVHGDVLPWRALTHGFVFDGQQIVLIGQAGIWKPRVLQLPISLSTSPSNPYGDVIGDDGLLLYRYQGSASRSYDNDLLRRAMRDSAPLIYFHAVSKGLYAALWPAVIVADDAATKTFTVACEDVDLLRPDLPATVVDEARRAYVTHLAVVRLHQAAFRQRVLAAYRERCTVCQIRHVQLFALPTSLPTATNTATPSCRMALRCARSTTRPLRPTSLGCARITSSRSGPTFLKRSTDRCFVTASKPTTEARSSWPELRATGQALSGSSCATSCFVEHPESWPLSGDRGHSSTPVTVVIVGRRSDNRRAIQ